MISFSDLPTLNAMLNACSAILLVMGHRMMKKGNIPAHRKLMIAAVTVSALFLVSYLFYHYGHGSQPFRGEGWIRPVYFAILISHTILATAIVPMALMSLYRGLKGRYESHQKIARMTYPVWLYVSTTGVVVYLMLYQLFTG